MTELQPGSTGAGAVDVVIVNWNSRDLLRRCLAALDTEPAGTVRDVVVVDNASTDGSAEIPQIRQPVRVLSQDRNLGFGRACNLGARAGQAPYILFLNPDTEVTDGCIAKAVEYLEAEPEAAVCGVRLIDLAGELQHHTIRFPGPMTIYSHAQRNNDFAHDESRDVDHVMGAFYLIRRSLFEALGGFDDRFFVYLEDVDLSLRVRQAGYRVAYLNEAVCRHVGGGTSAQIPARRLFYAMHSRLLYARKHFTLVERALVWSVTLAVEPWLRLAKAARKGSLADMRSTVGAFGMLYAALLSRRAAARLTLGADETASRPR